MKQHSCNVTSPSHPLSLLPQLPSVAMPAEASIPTAEECYALWDKYAMLDNVRAHSKLVAAFAVALAQRAQERGVTVSVEAVRASALLHDLAKTYTIKYGGSHAQIGASWVVAETGNRHIAQGVLMHVHWPWEISLQDVCTLPFFIIYADKRVMHDAYVSLPERYKDLLVRYGDTEQHKQSITASYTQGQTIENALSVRLELQLDAYTIDSGRLVQRA